MAQASGTHLSFPLGVKVTVPEVAASLEVMMTDHDFPVLLGAMMSDPE